MIKNFNIKILTKILKITIILLSFSNLFSFDYDGKKIKKVIFENLKNSEEKRLKMSLFLNEGSDFDQEMAENDIKNLFELGYFDDVILDISVNEDNTLTLKYIIFERPFIKEISIDGNKEFKTDKIKDFLQNKESSFYNKYLVKEDVKKIEEEYLKKGYLGTRVVISTDFIDKDKNTIRLNVKVTEGKELVIKKVDFSGNIFMKTDRFRAVLDSLKEPWAFNIKTYNLVRGEFEKDIERISKEAEKDGFVDFKINEINLDVYISYSFFVKNLRSLIRNYLDKEKEKEVLSQLLPLLKEKKFKELLDFLNDFFQKNISKIDPDDIEDFNTDKNYVLNNLLFFINIDDILANYLDSIRDIKINKKVIFTDDDSKMGFYITINVSEGNKYLFSGIDITGNKRMSEKEIRDNLSLDRGDVFLYDKFEDFLRNTYIDYQSDGFFYCKITPIEDKDTKRDTIFYTLDIYEGDKVHIENMYIVGNTKTKGMVIDRELRIKEGQVYDFSAIRRSQERLMKTQYFKNVEFEPKIGSEEGLIDIIWKVEEAKTGIFTLGGGYSTLSGLSGFAQISEMNLFGSGYNVSLRGDIGKNSRSITTSFGSGWIGYLPISYKYSVSYSWGRLFFVPKYDRNKDGYADKVILKEDGKYYLVQENNSDYNYYYDVDRDGSFITTDGAGNPSYSGEISSPEWPNTLDDISTERYIDKKTIGFSLGFGYSISEYWGVGIGQSVAFAKYYNPKYITVDNLYESDEYRLKTNLKDGNYSVVTKTSFSIGYDTTDDNLVPTKGFVFAPNISFYGLQGGYNKYTNLGLDLSGYVTVFSIKRAKFNIVWANHLGLETIGPLPGRNRAQTYSENKLSFDGIRELRGWGDYVYEDNLRGFGKVSFGSEIRIPIPGTERLLWWAFFFDAGNVSQNTFSLPTNLKDYKYSDGFGIKIELPVFPIRLYFAERREWRDGALRSVSSLNFLLSIAGFF